MAIYLKEEMIRAFLSKAMFISIIISIFLMFFGMFEALPWVIGGNSSILYTFLQGYNSGTGNFLIIAFPILACIPFAASYRTDAESGFNRYIYNRMKKPQYMVVRLIVNALAGGFVVFIGPFIAFLFLLIGKPIFGAPMVKEEMETVQFFNSIGIQSPMVMMFIILGILFMCGAIFSTFGLGVSVILNNKYVAMLVPFVYLIISATLLMKIHPYLNVIALYDVDYGMSFSQRFLYGGSILIISILLFFIGGSKRVEEKNI